MNTVMAYAVQRIGDYVNGHIALPDNREKWYQSHIWTAFFDRLFENIPDVRFLRYALLSLLYAPWLNYFAVESVRPTRLSLGKIPKHSHPEPEGTLAVSMTLLSSSVSLRSAQ